MPFQTCYISMNHSEKYFLIFWVQWFSTSSLNLSIAHYHFGGGGWPLISLLALRSFFHKKWAPERCPPYLWWILILVLTVCLSMCMTSSISISVCFILRDFSRRFLSDGFYFPLRCCDFFFPWSWLLLKYFGGSSWRSFTNVRSRYAHFPPPFTLLVCSFPNFYLCTWFVSPLHFHWIPRPPFFLLYFPGLQLISLIICYHPSPVPGFWKIIPFRCKILHSVIRVSISCHFRNVFWFLYQ